MSAIVAHGGAGAAKGLRQRKEGVRRAVEAGWEVLSEGGGAVDAVEAAVVIMEDNPLFNCGTGSALALNGEAEMDAALMCDDLQAGAVGAITDVRNPIKVARKVMEETDHVLIAGEGATGFARQMGFPSYDPITEERREQYREWLEGMREKGRGPRYFPKMAGLVRTHSFGTVGAVALDSGGRIAAATSTGGITLRLPGRVGDTPLIGAGTYANEFGGVSASGHGEPIAKLLLGKLTVDLMRRFSAQRAIDEALRIAFQHGARCGLIGLDRKGRIGFGHTTRKMPCAYVRDREVVVTE